MLSISIVLIASAFIILEIALCREVLSYHKAVVSLLTILEESSSE